jgi:hypothetical protein
MAEIATIARPYAEALFKAAGPSDPRELADQLDAVAQVASLPELRQLADNPKVEASTVYDVTTDALKAVALRPPCRTCCAPSSTTDAWPRCPRSPRSIGPSSTP